MLDPVYLDHVSDDMIELYTELDLSLIHILENPRMILMNT